MKKIYVYLIAAVLLVVSPWDSLAQKKKKKKKGDDTEQTTPPPKKKEGPKKVADEVKKMALIDGLFKLYRDSVSGSVKMVIGADQIDQQYIHWYYIENGATEAGLFKGQFRGTRVFRIEKYYNRIEFVRENTSSYFDPENPLSRAADANISRSVLYSGKILAGSEEEGQYLIEADPLFLKEVMAAIDFTYFRRDPNAFKLGGINKDKTKYVQLKNYEENTNVTVEYVYASSKPKNGGTRAVTDARNVSVKVQHSLIQIPENNYQPRYEDPRIGYFTTQVTDMTSVEATPYRDLISRWHLEKKDPNAAISDPVEPITWWIENTTPEEWRDVIREGVLQWNVAFEKAGFSNAMAVEVQPDDADWDAGDLRYNVLRWTSSPNPPFGGYGPSIVNPLTGQILGADIMLEFVFFTNRVKYTKLYNFAAHDETFESEYWDDHAFCTFGESMNENMLFGVTAMKAMAAPGFDAEGLKREGLKQLIMHEVGHTLGLNHNMKSSQLFSPSELYDKNVIEGKALTSSVMDYATINLSPNAETQGHYYSVNVGPYDEWAIEWGYKPATDQELLTIANRSTEPALTFGNDADDMRSSGKAIDPRVNTGDQSNDQIRYSIDRIAIARKLIGDLKDKYADEGESYQELRQAFLIAHAQHDRAVEVISRFIGGVYVDRAMQGQEGGTRPYTPVSYEDQKRAMNALRDYAFAPNAFTASTDLYSRLAMQRRGFNFFGSTEDPKIHELILGTQRSVLSHILHRNTLQRISDSEMYGNKYSLSEFMTNLNDAIFKVDAGRSVNSRRQNLQVAYTEMLINIISKDNYTNMAQSMALYNLKSIRGMARSTSGNVATRAHRQHLAFLIDKALDN